MRKKEFVDAVMAGVDANRSDAKSVIDATLLALSQVLQEGRTLAVAPFGKARVARVAGSGGAETIVIRYRPKAAGARGEAAEQGAAAAGKDRSSAAGKGGSGRGKDKARDRVAQSG